MTRRIRGVVFDVGYTLLDETRRWREWAEWIRVKPEELWLTMHAVIAEGAPDVGGRVGREALQRLSPGFDLKTARAERARIGRRDEFLAEDLYPDVSPCLARLKAAGFKLGAAGNTSEDVEHFLVHSGLGFDALGSSARWGVEKPDMKFFQRVSEVMQMAPEQLSYIGDRLDNDIVPAARAGMMAVLVRRGPWAEILADRPERQHASAVIDSLEQLPPLLTQEGRSEGSRTPPSRSKNVRPASR